MNNFGSVYGPINPVSRVVADFPYTAPSNSVWIGLLQPYSSVTLMRAAINGQMTDYSFINSDSYNQNKSSVSIPLLKGDVLSWIGSSIRIIYCSEFYTYR